MSTLSLEESFIAELNGHAGYSALCSTRTFSGQYRQDFGLPQSVFVQFSGSNIHDHSGATRAERAGYQFASYADNPKQAIQVQEELIACLRAVKKRRMGGANGIRISWVKVSRGPSGWDPVVRKPFRITEARFFHT